MTRYTAPAQGIVPAAPPDSAYHGGDEITRAAVPLMELRLLFSCPAWIKHNFHVLSSVVQKVSEQPDSITYRNINNHEYNYIQ